MRDSREHRAVTLRKGKARWTLRVGQATCRGHIRTCLKGQERRSIECVSLTKLKRLCLEFIAKATGGGRDFWREEGSEEKLFKTCNPLNLCSILRYQYIGPNSTRRGSGCLADSWMIPRSKKSGDYFCPHQSRESAVIKCNA